ncbi:MATH domain-containing protein [Caenorhabditis elegans]|nr:MATH domain-containing protein [Caenorhabditis elegans]CCD63732.1 MATH domain-containing protein [Caenorhabditis elegans]|eukprot:NP_001040772.1 MATH (meprin-associated Traf homology) domain containing [Caenorhabditis elegans]
MFPLYNEFLLPAVSSGPRKKFSLTYAAKNLSQFVAGEKQFSNEKVLFGIPWRLVVFENHDEIVGLSLSCGQCVQDSRKWSLSIEVELKLMSSSEKGFSKVRRLLVKTLTKIELQLLDTEDLIENFVSAESVRIQVDVKILEQKELKYETKIFELTYPIQNLARFENRESQSSDVRECFKVPWSIFVEKNHDFLSCHLMYEKELCTPNDWHIQGVCTFYLKSDEGKSFCNFYEIDLKGPGTSGDDHFIKWEDLIRNYSIDDSVTVIARVQITSLKRSFMKEGPISKSFVISQQFGGISSVLEGETLIGSEEKRFNIPWTIKMQRRSGFVVIFLYCRRKSYPHQIWTVYAKCWFKLVSANGKSLMRLQNAVFQCEDTCELDKFTRWEDMMTDYAIDDYVTIEAHVEIYDIVEKDIDLLAPSLSNALDEQTFYAGSFFSAFTISNISRFEDDEKQWGNTEKRYNIPWRLRAKKSFDFLEINLFCDEENIMTTNKLVEAECTFCLVSSNGNSLKQKLKLYFGRPGGQGVCRLVEWSELEEDYAVNDRVVIEAHVKIKKVRELSHEPLPIERSCVLSHTVRNIANMEESNFIFNITEEWYYVLWGISLKCNSGFVELQLNWENELFENESWTIQTRFQLSLIGANEKRITQYFEHTFDKPGSSGDSKFLRWEDMVNNYAIEDSVRVEACVRFIHVIATPPQKSFAMFYTLGNLSNVLEEEHHFSLTEKHFEIP